MHAALTHAAPHRLVARRDPRRTRVLTRWRRHGHAEPITPNSCSGSISGGEKEPGSEGTPVHYKFSCNGPITGYQLAVADSARRIAVRAAGGERKRPTGHRNLFLRGRSSGVRAELRRRRKCRVTIRSAGVLHRIKAVRGTTRRSAAHRDRRVCRKGSHHAGDLRSVRPRTPHGLPEGAQVEQAWEQGQGRQEGKGREEEVGLPA